jgi:hypothetical protein
VTSPPAGKGFESAVAYAVAARLGFGQAVTWTNASFTGERGLHAAVHQRPVATA